MIYGQEPHLPDIQIDTTAHFKHNPKSENALEEKVIHWVVQTISLNNSNITKFSLKNYFFNFNT